MFQPLRVGEHCPLNETAWMARKSQFNCTDTGGNPSKEYHCLPNNLGVPGEVCIGSSWVQPNYCPVFNLNAKNFDAQPCELQRGVCSTSQFQSKEVFKYSACLNFTRQPDPVADDYKPLNFLPVIVGGVAFVCLVVIIVCVVWLCRRSGGRRGGKKGRNGDVEMGKPLLKTFPTEFDRTCHYLSANMFHPTKVYTRCIGLFEVNGNLTLVGPHGSGKTTIAVSLLSKKINTTRNGKQCNVDVCSSIEEVESKVVDGVVSCVLLDDVLEQYAYQPRLLDDHMPIFDNLKKMIDNGQLCLICTITDTTWKNNLKVFDRIPLFKKELVIELNEKSFDKHEKFQILKMHLSYNKFGIVHKSKEENLGTVNKRQEEASSITISEGTLSKWVKKAKVKGGIGIPLLFDLMSINRHLFASADTLLGDSLESVLKMRITHLWKDSTEQESKDYVALLAFTACSGGRVSIENFDAKSKEDKKYVGICSRIGCSKKLQGEVKLMLKSKEMQGFLHPLGPDSYIFHHKILTPLVLSVFPKDNASWVAEYADLDVLFKVLQPPRGKYPVSVSLSEEALIALISRICTKKPDDIAKWKQHVVMQTSKLQKEFENALKENGVKE